VKKAGRCAFVHTPLLGYNHVEGSTLQEGQVDYKFEWNPAKERANIHEHKVSFRKAATVFRDPNQLSIYDEEHSEYEDRWITLGVDSSGVLRVVVHTFEQVDENLREIRIISARKATSREARQYREGNL
jgi:uncharacterized DUF497 family protein